MHDTHTGDVMLLMQIVETRIRAACPNDAFRRAFGRYVNEARHHLPPAFELGMEVRHAGSEYILPSGRRELSAEAAAEAAWAGLERQLQDTLRPWLQVAGLCIDHGGRRLLVLSRDEILGTTVLYALAGGLRVASGAGICLRDGTAVPYALPFEIIPEELERFRIITGCQADGLHWRNEMGVVRAYLSPQQFGLAWDIIPQPVDAIMLLAWNPGGRSGLGPRRHPIAALEHILAAAYLPPDLGLSQKLAQTAQARLLAGSAPMRVAHLGRFEDFAPLVMAQLETVPARA
jgi:hypothetical protein